MQATLIDLGIVEWAKSNSQSDNSQNMLAWIPYQEYLISPELALELTKPEYSGNSYRQNQLLPTARHPRRVSMALWRPHLPPNARPRALGTARMGPGHWVRVQLGLAPSR